MSVSAGGESLGRAYEFATAGQIVFGWGRRHELGRRVAPLGRRAWLVLGSQTIERSGRLAEIVESLSAAGVEAQRLPRVTREPTIADVDAAVAAARRSSQRCAELVIAVGGGAAIDLAKAVAALAAQPGEARVRDYLEGVGTGRQLAAPPLAVAALPTTAGTGSEVTRNAVIACDDPPCKKSLRHPALLPRLAVVDPELTVTNPRQVTVHSGLDAITQLIESYLTRRRNPLTAALVEAGLGPAIAALPRAAAAPWEAGPRIEMAQAALWSGLALANSGLGLAHGLAAALGAVCPVPHGLACAVMLPIALAANLESCSVELAHLERRLLADGAEEPAAETKPAAGGRIAHPTLRLGASGHDEHHALAAQFCRRIELLLDALQVPRRLRLLGVNEALIPRLVAGSHGNSRSGNPRDVSDEELAERLAAAL